ncbi:MAG: adenylyl-sulfate kinase [Beijerinckiaceae bacterium]|nr:adenylyl-sulfate kinase [Beijerinckiaceae bacterium]
MSVRSNDFQLVGISEFVSKTQTGMIVWFTGLSGAGKTTIALKIKERLDALNLRCCLLDGDDLRRGLNSDLGYSDEDRVENMRRTAEVAALMARAGLITISSLISPFAKERRIARVVAGDLPFFEVFIDAPLALCEQRDPKGLYKRARQGSIKDFTGIGSAYEPPVSPDLRLDTGMSSADDLAAKVVELILAKQV